MDARRARWIAASVIAIEAVILLAGLVSDRLLVHAGHADLVGFRGETWVLLLGVASAALVGFAIVRTQPRHPVGWLFMALSATILVSSPLEAWIEWGRLARPGSLPGTGAVAAINDATWIPWFVLVALILLLTPTGTYLSPSWRALGRVIVGAGAIAFLLSLVKTDPFESPFQDIENPWAVPAIQPASAWVEYGLVLLVAAGLIASGGSLLLRWRRARGDDRRQLLWLALVVVPLPLFVVARSSPRASELGRHDRGDRRVRRADPDRGRTVDHPLPPLRRRADAGPNHDLCGLTLLLIGTYALVVWFGARGAQRWSVSPAVAATVGALAVAAIAAPARRGIQDQIDRRFNRRRYDAVDWSAPSSPTSGPARDLEAVFRRAFGDPTV